MRLQDMGREERYHMSGTLKELGLIFQVNKKEVPFLAKREWVNRLQRRSCSAAGSEAREGHQKRGLSAG